MAAATVRAWRRAGTGDGLAEARFEAALGLLRSAVALSGAVVLALSTPLHPELRAPAVAGAAVAAASLAAARWVSRLRTVRAVRRVGVIGTIVDLAIYATWSAAFADRPGGGMAFSLYVLLIGPVRWGWRGAVVTGLPVGLTATVWRQADADGSRMPVGQVWLLVVLFGALAAAVHSASRRSTARRRQAEQQFATAFEHASIGMALTSDELTVQQVNRSLAELVNRSASDLVGTALHDLVDEPDRARLRAALTGLTAQDPVTRLEVELRRPDGGVRSCLLAGSLLAGSADVVARIVVQVENVTERRTSEALLSHRAGHDALTDLPNRTLLLTRMEEALQRTEQIAVLFIDLDRFKAVNDAGGHAAGDQLLLAVADRLREAMRPDDLVARLGGDEFVVLCREADGETAAHVAARILALLGRPIPVAGSGEFAVGASIGVAVAEAASTAELLLRDADTAMYAAKRAGGGQTRTFTVELRDAVVRASALEVDLRSEVRHGGLRLAYQPVVDLAHGTIIGCEALARWDDPQRGPVDPQEFIAVAEQSDLIVELGLWVLRAALQDAAGWTGGTSPSGPTIGVNVSVRQLTGPGFIDQVRAELVRSGVPPARLCLEVTETALGGDVEQVIEALRALRGLGVQLAIDDFGTGHASLTYLARFPAHQVKIDRSFVAGLGVDSGSAAIVGGVVAMAHAFDLRVVAEGVEREDQLAALRALGCDAAQGYLVAAPMDADRAAALFSTAGEAVPVPGQRPPTGRPPVRQSPRHGGEVQRLQLLIEDSRDVTACVDLDSVLDRTLAALGRLVPLTGGSIHLVREGQVWRVACSREPAPTAVTAPVPLGQGFSGMVALTGQPRYLPDVTIAATLAAAQRTTPPDVRSWYGVPLVADGRAFGVLEVEAQKVDAFGEQDRLAVLSFAPVVALAVRGAGHDERELSLAEQSAGFG